MPRLQTPPTFTLRNKSGTTSSSRKRSHLRTAGVVDMILARRFMRVALQLQRHRTGSYVGDSHAQEFVSLIRCMTRRTSSPSLLSPVLMICTAMPRVRQKRRPFSIRRLLDETLFISADQLPRSLSRVVGMAGIAQATRYQFCSSRLRARSFPPRAVAGVVRRRRERPNSDFAALSRSRR